MIALCTFLKADWRNKKNQSTYIETSTLLRVFSNTAQLCEALSPTVKSLSRLLQCQPGQQRWDSAVRLWPMCLSTSDAAWLVTFSFQMFPNSLLISLGASNPLRDLEPGPLSHGSQCVLHCAVGMSRQKHPSLSTN